MTVTGLSGCHFRDPPCRRLIAVDGSSATSIITATLPEDSAGFVYKKPREKWRLYFHLRGSSSSSPSCTRVPAHQSYSCCLSKLPLPRLNSLLWDRQTTAWRSKPPVPPTCPAYTMVSGPSQAAAGLCSLSLSLSALDDSGRSLYFARISEIHN